MYRINADRCCPQTGISLSFVSIVHPHILQEHRPFREPLSQNLPFLSGAKLVRLHVSLSIVTLELLRFISSSDFLIHSPSSSCCPRVSMISISADTHPHILDTVIASASYGALLALRAASRSFRERADTRLVQHIAAFNGSQEVFSVDVNGQHHRIPWERWFEVPALADAVRVVDICTSANDEEQGRQFDIGRTRLRDTSREHYGFFMTVYPPRCWCNQERGVPVLNALLASRLHRVQLIRQWRGHRCKQTIAAPRMITFVNSDPTIRDEEVPINCPVHVLHIAPKVGMNLLLVPSFASELFIRSAANTSGVRIKGLSAVDPTERTGKAARPPTVAYVFSRLTWTVVRHLADGISCTFVGFENWQELQAYPDLEEIRIEMMNTIEGALVNFRHVEREDAKDLVAHRLRFVSEEEYRASIGEEMYALEGFCTTPTGLAAGQ